MRVARLQLAIGLHSLCFLNSKMRHHLFVSLFLSFPTDGHGLMGTHLVWQSSSLALYYQMETSTQISLSGTRFEDTTFSFLSIVGAGFFMCM
jgi:hypothetical protein